MSRYLVIAAVFLLYSSSLMASCPETLSGIGKNPEAPVTPEQIMQCMKSNKECPLLINKEKATEIALSAHFQEGVEPWKFELFWSFEKGYYVWRITNTISKKEYSSHGNIIELNAQTGKDVCDAGAWFRDS